jgi:peptidoglycan/xylan/chitin deacetylase (PgdA/CDA1 family)
LSHPDTLWEHLVAQRGIGGAAVAVGFLVLAVLVGGRMVGSWQHSGQLSHLASAERRGSHHRATSPAPAARPASPSPSDAAARGSAAPTRTPAGGTNAGAAAKPPAPPRPPKPRPGGADPTFGAKRTTGSSAVALTFDDGPDPTSTPQMLDLLKQYGIKATFCLVGVHVRDYPELVERIVREGHTLCNHSWLHDIKLGEKTPDQIRADLARTSAEIRKAVPNARIPYYRQPGGKWTADIVSIAKSMGMTPLGWAVDPSDWAKPGTQVIIDRVTQHTFAGSIVLMHDGGGDRSETLAACRTLFPWFKQHFKLAQLR